MVALNISRSRRVGIVICTLRRPEQLEQTLHSLVEANESARFNAYVIDQAPSRDLERMVRDKAAKMPAGSITYVGADFVGLARARNYAVRFTSEEILGFIDDDCIFTRKWLTAVERGFADPSVDGMFGRVLAYGYQDDIAYRQRSTVWGTSWQASRQDGMLCDALNLRPSPAMFCSPCLPYANLGSGNNMAFRRSVFERWGLFNEHLGAGSWLPAGEDTEFQYRLLKQGCRLLYSPDMQVYHNGWRTPEQTATLKLGYDAALIAVFWAYALRGDRLCARFLVDRICHCINRVVEHEVTITSAVGAVSKGFVGGCIVLATGGGTGW